MNVNRHSQYTVCEGMNVGELTRAVEGHIRAGWQTVGGVSSFDGRLLQAMVLTVVTCRSAISRSTNGLPAYQT